MSISLLINSFFGIPGSMFYHQHRSANVPSTLFYDYNLFTLKGSVDVRLYAMERISVVVGYNNAGIAIVNPNYYDAIFSGHLIR
jgi:hypothetical protein